MAARYCAVVTKGVATNLQDLPFENLYAHGFVRVAAATPAIRVTDPVFNSAQTVEQVRAAHEDDVSVVVFPELGLVGYTNQDLFHQQSLLDGALDALDRVRAATTEARSVVVVGLPLRVGHQLFNVAAVLHRGRVLGLVPKSYLPNYGEFYEKRQFTSGLGMSGRSVRLLGQAVPFGP